MRRHHLRTNQRWPLHRAYHDPGSQHCDRESHVICRRYAGGHGHSFDQHSGYGQRLTHNRPGVYWRATAIRSYSEGEHRYCRHMERFRRVQRRRLRDGQQRRAVRRARQCSQSGYGNSYGNIASRSDKICRGHSNGSLPCNSFRFACDGKFAGRRETAVHGECNRHDEYRGHLVALGSRLFGCDLWIDHQQRPLHRSRHSA